MTVNEGEAFVAGSDAATARRLLQAARDAGLPTSVVRTSPDGGFIVPAQLVREKKKAEPDEREEQQGREPMEESRGSTPQGPRRGRSAGKKSADGSDKKG